MNPISTPSEWLFVQRCATYRANEVNAVEEVAHVVHDGQLRRDPLDFGEIQHELVFLGQQVDVLFLDDEVFEQLRLLLGRHHLLQQFNVLQREGLQIQVVDGFYHRL